MRIAIPTEDGATVAMHFGHCRAFLVFDVADGRIAQRELRGNAGCQHDAHAGNQDAAHAGIASVLADCEVVLCGGIGAGAVGALRAMGVREVVMTNGGAAEGVVTAYLDGTLQPRAGGMCRCSH